MQGVLCSWYWISFVTQNKMTPVLLTFLVPPARYLARFGRSPSNRYAAGLFSVLVRMKNDIVLKSENDAVFAR